MADLAALTAAIEAGNRTAAAELTQAAIDGGIDPKEILGAMTAAMDVVGRGFQDGELFVPEMLIAARAMKTATAILEPVLASAGVVPEFRAIVGTVEGDLHARIPQLELTRVSMSADPLVRYRGDAQAETATAGVGSSA